MPTCVCLLPPHLPQAELPSALSGLLGRLRLENWSCAAVAEDLAAGWCLPDGLYPALRAIAAEADRSGTANSYHNPAHTRDVAVNFANLVMLTEALSASGAMPLQFAAETLALGLCAAFGHDLMHDGIGNVCHRPAASDSGATQRVHIPFRLERLAADLVCRLMRDNGVAPGLCAPVAAAILATDPAQGLQALSAPALLDHLDWRMLAMILRDADILASAGLTAAEHDLQSRLLGVEFDADLNTPYAAESLFAQAAEERFQSPAGALFLPQLQALRALNQVRGSKRGWLTLEEASLRLSGSPAFRS